MTIFKMGPAEAELGEVETGLVKSPVESKTKPVFKISITKVAADTTS